MPKEILKRGATSNIIRVFLQDSASTTGAGKTALTSTSSGLIISTIADLEATATTYTSAATNVETITTLGTFAAPTASKCRFREVDATNFPGVYEIQIADARFAVANSTQLLISIQCTGVAPVFVEYQLVAVDLMDTVRFGLTALPNVAQGTAGALSTGNASGQVTVATNNDKTGYSLTQTFPANFNLLAINGSGAVTAGTVSDKTGYSLTQTFPTNFNLLAINGSGAVTAGTVSDKTGYSLSVAPPTAAQIWATDVSGYTTAGQAGTYQNKLDAAITTRMASFTYTAPLNSGQTASAVWDALLASYTVNNSFGQRVLRSTTSQSTCAVTGSNHIAADIHELQAGVITSADFSAGAIDANALATDAATEIATATWTTDISGISIAGQAGRYLTDSAVSASNASASASIIEATAYKESVADILLGRNVAGGSNTGRLVKEALYALRNKSEIVGNTLNVYNNVDGAIAWTAAVSSSATADPVTGIDPA
jgi:hypothetical protein